LQISMVPLSELPAFRLIVPASLHSCLPWQRMTFKLDVKDSKLEHITALGLKFSAVGNARVGAVTLTPSCTMHVRCAGRGILVPGLLEKTSSH